MRPSTLHFLFITFILITLSACTSKTEYQYPFQNPSLEVTERVDDLVGRLTIEEKILQMVNDAPAIDRLGIPEYNWWNEGLHGVARAGLATVFPQAIGLGATWNDELMFEVAEVISDETRAKHHNFVSEDKRKIYQGLTLWSPNINIFRDPRWGRGQETYGEDPYLTGKMGTAFVKGLQGDNSKYFKTIATLKHFAVHNGPEPERHYFNAIASKRDLWETYLPQFEMGIRDGKAYSIMCAYNRYNDEPCCSSDPLLNSILRNELGFNGYVVSDCGAIRDIYNDHKVVDTPAEAAAVAVKAGTDLNCGFNGGIYPHLKEALEKGLIDEATIDKSVKRLFEARFRLGLFDPPEMVEYANIPYSVLNSRENKQLATRASHESMVLLKNENGILPLDKNLKNIAVIGPNADQWLMLLGNYNGMPENPITPFRGISDKLPGSNVSYAQGCDLTDGMPVFSTIPSQHLSTEDNKTGLLVEYFDNQNFEGKPVDSEITPVVDVNWSDKAPRPLLDDDNFSARWTGFLKPVKSGYYQLGYITTCNTQLYLNDSLLLKTRYHYNDEFGDPRLQSTDKIWLDANQSYSIKIDAAESYADASVQLIWKVHNENLKDEAIQLAEKSDVVIMCMGLTARMEGEEMKIEIDGFRGGDRTKLGLPEVQLDLIKSIHALGKPVVLVLLNGSALAINWENENIPAILEAWYPGQAGGAAIADILFGDYNPAGKLPVTFYKSVADLPPFEQYQMTTQTYRYFEGEPLYPFGFGLSYSSFEFSNLSVKEESGVNESIDVSVTIKNTSNVDGQEVVQVYLKSLDGSDPKPLISLKAFKRVTVLAGEETSVTFSLDPTSFYTFGNNDERVIEPGKFVIYVGNGLPGTMNSNSLQATISKVN